MKMSALKSSLLILIGVGAAGQMTNAAPVTVPDYSFENTTNITAPGGTTAAPNVGPSWHGSGNSGVFLADMTNGVDFNGPPLPPTGDGTNYLVENIHGNTARCWQDVGTLQPNAVYTLTVAVGNSFADSGTDTGQGFIALVNGTGPFNTILGSAAIDSGAVAPGSFSDFTLVFTNGYQAGGDLTILLEGDTGTQILYDNVRLDVAAMPDAATALPIHVSPGETVYVGTQVTLNENPAGVAPFSYEWQTDNGSGGASWSDTGGNSTNLVVDTSGFTASVQYRVIVANSFGSSTSAPVTLTAYDSQPVLVSDVVPALGSDVVGSSVTFSAQFDGTRPIGYQWFTIDINGSAITPIEGATNSTLTITNLQPSNYAFYYLEASNALGTTDSSWRLFIVSNAPAALANGVVISPANQSGLGGATQYTPTWNIKTNDDLLWGLSPAVAGGNFQLEGAGGISFMTDGQFGFLPPAGNAGTTLATCGNGGGSGTNVIYTLPATPNGWDLTNITVYGGWSDQGRDQQRYLVYYSTVADPTHFNNLIADVNFNPDSTISLPSVQSATRTTVTSTNGVLARGVAAVEFYFYTLNGGVENGYSGYAEFQAFGTPSQALPVLVKDIQPGRGFDVEGSEVTFRATFSSDSPLTYQWFKDGAPIPNATNAALTLANLQSGDTAQSPGYALQASNAVGAVFSSAAPFVVNPAPAPDGYGVLNSFAGQTGNGSTFTPTWNLATGNLMAGLLPAAATYSGGSFGNENAGGVPVLTDNQFGSVGSGINATLATMGNGSAGRTLTYILPTAAAYGYDISNIVTYGGWSDIGRDAQAYTVSYSTVANPTTFITLDAVSQVPTSPAAPNGTRLILSPAAGGILASNVYAVKFDFTTPVAPAQENGWSGYAELQVLGAPSAPLTALAPTVQQDILPSAGADVVGSSVTFTANFIGSGTIAYQWQKNGTNIPNANSATLTLNNLQTTDSGNYNVIATSTYGSVSSSTNTFTVNPAPTAVNGTVAAPAYQNGYVGAGFTPTWTLATGSLIAGQNPVSSSGNFKNEACGGVNYLTAGSPGAYGAGNYNLASGGPGGGTSVTYSLGTSPAGYDLSEVVVYGGWTDSGRDSLGFTVSYSTVDDPNTFVSLTSPQTTYNYSPPGSVPTSARLTVTSATATPLAKKVANVRITFTSVPNNWSGYGQVQLFGVLSGLTPVTFTSTKLTGGNLIMTGTGGTAGAGYTILSATNLALPLSDWTTNSTGTFDGNGAFSNAIPQGTANEFFRLRIP